MTGFATANDAAMANLGFDRRPEDQYQTPEWITTALLQHLRGYPIWFGESEVVWEPACGEGRMARVLARHFRLVVATELFDQGFGTTGIDFLATTDIGDVRGIITNPPYGDMAARFIRHALELTAPVCGIVAMLCRNEYDGAIGRRELFDRPPFAKKVVLHPRPRWIEGTTGGPRHYYAWYIWNHQHRGPAVIGYGTKGDEGEADR